jgi:hypothetical protein
MFVGFSRGNEGLLDHEIFIFCPNQKENWGWGDAGCAGRGCGGGEGGGEMQSCVYVNVTVPRRLVGLLRGARAAGVVDVLNGRAQLYYVTTRLLGNVDRLSSSRPAFAVS